MTNPRFSTALREYVRGRIEHLPDTDIVIGIPAFYSSTTIQHVIDIVAKGLDQYYHDRKALIFVSDGGSTDDTRESADSVIISSYNIEKVTNIYRGIPGKGSALRAVFEAANFLRAKAVAVVDSDLVSITPEWVNNLLTPLFNGYDYVTPDYKRYKFDATITNTIAYTLTRALYGYRIRQPIGGDFGVSPLLVKHFLNQNVWETQVAKFGIDIWMTTTAIVNGFRICQARLGAKVHETKDPADDLSPMYREVVGTIFTLMEQYEDSWKNVKKSYDIPVFGAHDGHEPEALEISQEPLIEYFQLGYNNFSGIWKKLIGKNDMKVIEDLAGKRKKKEFLLPVEVWVRVVYNYAQSFHSTPRQKFKLLNTMIPLYNARVASLINELRDKTSEEADEYFEEEALAFEKQKSYLRRKWK